MIILINFADKGYVNARNLQKTTALQIGNIDKVIEYSLDDLDNNFKEKNKDLLAFSKGAGYWIWKPYLILKTLLEINDNDILIYCDSAISFVSSIYPYLDKLIGSFILFSLDHKETKFTKGDVFKYLKCTDNLNIINTPILDASHSIWKKNENSINFVKEWLALCENYQLITDEPSIEPNFNDFLEHRHDQSIMSCLGKLYKEKYNIDIIGDSSEFGNCFRDSSLPQLLWHHRNRN
jgi:hypothetical protein